MQLALLRVVSPGARTWNSAETQVNYLYPLSLRVAREESCFFSRSHGGQRCPGLEREEFAHRAFLGVCAVVTYTLNKEEVRWLLPTAIR